MFFVIWVFCRSCLCVKGECCRRRLSCFTHFSKQLVVDKRQRPLIPATLQPELATLIRACWQHQPEQRPTANQIVVVLQKVKP